MILKFEQLQDYVIQTDIENIKKWFESIFPDVLAFELLRSNSEPQGCPCSGCHSEQFKLFKNLFKIISFNELIPILKNIFLKESTDKFKFIDSVFIIYNWSKGKNFENLSRKTNSFDFNSYEFNITDVLNIPPLEILQLLYKRIPKAIMTTEEFEELEILLNLLGLSTYSNKFKEKYNQKEKILSKFISDLDMMKQKIQSHQDKLLLEKLILKNKNTLEILNFIKPVNKYLRLLKKEIVLKIILKAKLFPCHKNYYIKIINKCILFL